jgi:hypothetical protein
MRRERCVNITFILILIIIQDSNLSQAMYTERAEETNLKQTFHKEAMKLLLSEITHI